MPGELMDMWSFLEQQKRELMFVNQDSVPEKSVAKTMPSNMRSMLQSIIDRTSNLPTPMPMDPMPTPTPSPMPQPMPEDPMPPMPQPMPMDPNDPGPR